MFEITRSLHQSNNDDLPCLALQEVLVDPREKKTTNESIYVLWRLWRKSFFHSFIHSTALNNWENKGKRKYLQVHQLAPAKKEEHVKSVNQGTA